MLSGGDAAGQVVRLSLEGLELDTKISGEEVEYSVAKLPYSGLLISLHRTSGIRSSGTGVLTHENIQWFEATSFLGDLIPASERIL